MKRGYPPKERYRGELVAWYRDWYWVWRVKPFSGARLLAAVRCPPLMQRDYQEEHYQRSMKVKREEPGSVGVGRAQPSANGLALEKIAPTLARFMLDVQWDDGERRIPSILQIRMANGMWEVSLQDRNWAKILILQVETWTEAVPALEAALASGKAPWQHADWLERFLPKVKGRKKT